MCNVAQVRYLMSFRNARRWAIIYNILNVPRAKRGVITVYILHTAHAIIICMCVCLSNDRNHCEQVALQLSLASTASSGGQVFNVWRNFPQIKIARKGRSGHSSPSTTECPRLERFLIWWSETMDFHICKKWSAKFAAWDLFFHKQPFRRFWHNHQ